MGRGSLTATWLSCSTSTVRFFFLSWEHNCVHLTLERSFLSAAAQDTHAHTYTIPPPAPVRALPWPLLCASHSRVVLVSVQQVSPPTPPSRGSRPGHPTRNTPSPLPHPQESACSKPDDDILDIPLDDPGANAAAAKIQASFRGHMARKKIKSGERGRKGPGPGGPGGAGGARGGAGGGPSGD